MDRSTGKLIGTPTENKETNGLLSSVESVYVISSIYLRDK